MVNLKCASHCNICAMLVRDALTGTYFCTNCSFSFMPWIKFQPCNTPCLWCFCAAEGESVLRWRSLSIKRNASSLSRHTARGGARGGARGRGHHWPKLGHSTQNSRFCPFFFLTRNTFIKMRIQRISLWPHKTGDFSDAHFSFISAPGAGQTSFSRTTVIWWDAVRLYIIKTNVPVLSAVTVLTAHTLQLYTNIRRTLYYLHHK